MGKFSALTEKIDNFAVVVAILGIGAVCPHIEIDGGLYTELQNFIDKLGIFHDDSAFDDTNSPVQFRHDAPAAALAENVSCFLPIPNRHKLLETVTTVFRSCADRFIGIIKREMRFSVIEGKCA